MGYLLQNSFLKKHIIFLIVTKVIHIFVVFIKFHGTFVWYLVVVTKKDVLEV